MAFGAKTNERPGVRAEVKYVRSSAYKAREILNLIRGLPVARALEVLEMAERDIARVVLKCLESAIANAEHNNQIPATTRLAQAQAEVERLVTAEREAERGARIGMRCSR